MDFKKLKGLTIQDVIVEEHTVYDDDPTIVLWCSNGQKYRIEGGFEEGTDESADVMRSTLKLSSVNVKKEVKYRVDEMEKNEGVYSGKLMHELMLLSDKDRLDLAQRIIKELVEGL